MKHNQLKIKLDTAPALNRGVPPYVLRGGVATFAPQDFKPMSDRFVKDRLYTAEQQLESINDVLEKPKSPKVICITGAIDDREAKILAAHIVQSHNRKLGLKANPTWTALYGGFDTLVDEYKDTFKLKPSMVVVSNLTPSSTNHRLERARDILDYFQDVPRIVVASGEDPISFMAFRMRFEVHAIAYFSSVAIRQSKVEAI